MNTHPALIEEARRVAKRIAACHPSLMVVEKHGRIEVVDCDGKATLDEYGTHTVPAKPFIFQAIRSA